MSLSRDVHSRDPYLSLSQSQPQQQQQQQPHSQAGFALPLADTNLNSSVGGFNNNNNSSNFGQNNSNRNNASSQPTTMTTSLDSSLTYQNYYVAPQSAGADQPPPTRQKVPRVRAKKQPAQFSFAMVSSLLARRKQLCEMRKRVADWMLALAIIGILCMILDTELCIQFDDYDKDGAGSKFIKSMDTLSTLALLAFSAYFHYIETKIYLIENGMDDWRLYVTNRKLFKFALELLVLAIHPIPGNYDYKVVDSADLEGDGDGNSDNSTTAALPVVTAKQLIIEGERVPVDAVLSVPMFLRAFLICRAVKLHSKIFEDVACHSLGALNRVRIDFQFIFKAYMQQYPGYSLTLIITGLFMLLSWSVRACEMYHKDKSNLDDLRDAMWLIAITFLTVGYGDIVPVSYCGRTISVLTGMSGAACTALIVAVLTRKLELSREEKYLHSFVTDIEIGKKLRASAACIIQNSWRAFQYRKHLAPDSLVLRHDRKVLTYIARMSKLKEDRRSLGDSTLSVQEIYQTHLTMNAVVERTQSKAVEIDSKLDTVEKNLMNLHEKIDLLLKRK